MTTEQTALQRLKEVCEQATPGPWVMVSGNDADLRDMIFSKFKNRLVAQTAFAESRQQETLLL